jgi:hypothetical protein
MKAAGATSRAFCSLGCARTTIRSPKRWAAPELSWPRRSWRSHLQRPDRAPHSRVRRPDLRFPHHGPNASTARFLRVRGALKCSGIVALAVDQIIRCRRLQDRPWTQPGAPRRRRKIHLAQGIMQEAQEILISGNFNHFNADPAIVECTALDSDEESVPSELEASKPFIPIDAPMQRLKQRRPAHR